jgi:hypothetical protein
MKLQMSSSRSFAPSRLPSRRSNSIHVFPSLDPSMT